MSDAQPLKSDDHKKLICDIMSGLLDEMTREELDDLQTDNGTGWISYKSQARWKRKSKKMIGAEVVRAFEHQTMPGSFTITEMPGSKPDSVVVKIEMGDDLPKQFASAAKRKGGIDTGIGVAARVHDPKDSILQGEKPAGFGDFS